MKQPEVAQSRRGGLRLLVVVCTAFAAVVVNDASADVFPNSDGSGELSSTAAWGSPAWFSTTSPYGNSAYNLELDAAGTYTITGNVAFAKLVNNLPKNKEAVIDCTTVESRPKVSLTGLQGNSTANNIHGTVFRLKGGDWDLGGGTVDYSTYFASNRKIVLDDYAVVTNVGDLNLAKTTLMSNEVVLLKGSKMFVSGAVSLCARKDGSFLRVTGGSTFYHAGASGKNFQTGTGANSQDTYSYSSGRNGIIVSNANSRAFIAMGSGAYFYLGNGVAGGLLHVTDHAYVQVGANLRIANAGQLATTGPIGSNALVRVEGGGCLCTDQAVYLPYGPTFGDIPGGNRFEVLADSAYTNKDHNAFYLREKGNAFVVSNGIAAVGNISVTGTGNEIVLQGVKPQFVCTAGTGHGFQLGSGNCIRFEIPPAGYAPDLVPVVSDKNVVFDEGSNLEISGLPAVLSQMARDGVKTKTMTLMEVSGKFTGMDSVVAAIEEAHALPEGCSLSVSGKQLNLTCTVKQGFTLIFR